MAEGAAEIAWGSVEPAPARGGVTARSESREPETMRAMRGMDRAGSAATVHSMSEVSRVRFVSVGGREMAPRSRKGAHLGLGQPGDAGRAGDRARSWRRSHGLGASAVSPTETGSERRSSFFRMRSASSRWPTTKSQRPWTAGPGAAARRPHRHRATRHRRCWLRRRRRCRRRSKAERSRSFPPREPAKCSQSEAAEGEIAVVHARQVGKGKHLRSYSDMRRRDQLPGFRCCRVRK
jgi:hypothetical protein